jgi:hypothetical protein
MVFEEKVKNKVRIFCHVPTHGMCDFSPSDAMNWAGLAAELADTETCKGELARCQRHFEKKYGPPPCKDDET